MAATINKAIAEHIIVMIAPERLEKITAMSVIAMPIRMAVMLLSKTIVFQFIDTGGWALSGAKPSMLEVPVASLFSKTKKRCGI